MGFECYCDDYDQPDLYQSTKPKARKEHRCYECGGKIMPGEQYERVFGVWSSEASTYKTCERCYDLRMWVKNNVPCFCWAHGNMLDDARETTHEVWLYAKEEAQGLWFGFLRRRLMIDRHNKRTRDGTGSNDTYSLPA